MTPDPDNGGVTYTVKELLQQLSTKLDAIDAKLEDKADRSRVHELANQTAALELRLVTMEQNMLRRDGPYMDRISAAEGRIEKLEISSAASSALTRWQRWFFGTIGLGLTTSLIALTTALLIHFH